MRQRFTLTREADPHTGKMAYSLPNPHHRDYPLCPPTKPVLCVAGARKLFGTRAKQFTVVVATKRPRRKGWIKVVLGPNYGLAKEVTGYEGEQETYMSLRSFAPADTFWVKRES